MAGRAPDALTLELLTWVGSRPRSYAEAMDAWRSNCPRHPVWENALGAGLVRIDRQERGSQVLLTPRGRTLLAAARLDARG